MSEPIGLRSEAEFGKALKWAFVLNWGRRAWAAIVTFVLAALLGPEAFGTVALANVFVAFIEMFLEQGMSNALIQRKDLREDHLDAAFWMILGVSIVLALVCLGLSPWWAAANDTPQLGAVVAVLSISLPIRGLTVVQQAYLQRGMDFKSLAIRANLSTMLGGAVGIGMAFAGYGVWSLVGQQLSGACVGLVLLWGLSSWRPGPRFQFVYFKQLLGFSVGAFLARLGLFVHKRVDVIVMGLMFGPVAVGIYRLADRLMNLPLELSTRAVQMVSLSDFSRLQDDPERLEHSVGRATWSAVTLAVPGLAVLAAVSDFLLPMLGDKWLPAVEPLKLLCLVGVVNASMTLTGPLLQALGRPHAMAGLVWVWGTLSTLSAYVVAFWLKDATVAEQALGIAATRAAISLLIHFPVHVTILKMLSGIPWTGLGGVLAPSAVAGVIAYGTTELLRRHAPVDSIPAVAQLCVGGATAVVLCAVTLLVLDPRARHFLHERGAKLVARRASTGTTR